MTDEEILKLRNVLLIPDTLEECKRLAQLLWTSLLRSPWNTASLQHLEDSYNNYKKRSDSVAIEITAEGIPYWSRLSYYMETCVYNHLVIYLNSNKNMEERNITVTIEQAKEWYNSNNETLRTLALNAYKREELELTYDYIIQKGILHLSTGSFLTPPCLQHKAITLSKLSNIAYYLNDGWKMRAGKTGYCIGQEVRGSYAIHSICLVAASSNDIGIYKHENVMYAGIVYFKSVDDAKEAARLLGDDIKYLF